MYTNLLNVLFMNIKTYIFTIGAIIIAFFAPIGPLLLIVAFAIFCDTILGIFKSYKKKIKITSRRMSALISKMFLYQFCIIGIFLIDQFILGEFINMFSEVKFVATKMVTLTLISIELKSINENIESAFQINIWDSLKKMISRAKEIKEDVNEN
jgi:hypothetical protein